jgi:hypothetical protein
MNPIDVWCRSSNLSVYGAFAAVWETRHASTATQRKTYHRSATQNIVTARASRARRTKVSVAR